MVGKSVLKEQINYYRARADEYDDWFYRRRNYDHGEELNEQWFYEVNTVREALYRLSPVESALELAAGTGVWTTELVKVAQHVTAIDASKEMIAISQHKLPGANVTHLQQDLFNWEPDCTYDLVLFAFWLSHVPPEQLARFLKKVSRAVKPGGKLFMIDSRKTEIAGAKGRSMHTVDEIYHIRQLNDGRKFRVVKVYYEPDALEHHFSRAGFEAVVNTTENFLIFAVGQRY